MLSRIGMETDLGKLGWLGWMAGARMVGVRPAAHANHKASSKVYLTKQLTGCINAWRS
jgi:hypothetical protein